MDPLKIIIFIAAFGALLLIGRILSASSEVHAADTPRRLPEPASGVTPIPQGDLDERGPAVIGAEIEFPIKVPPVEERPDGSYNRPNILNYYFAKTDLLHGPADSDGLFDTLFVQAQDPATRYRLEYRYTVATPTGLRRLLEQEKLASLYLDSDPVIIVQRWDLALILRTVMDEIMKSYGGEGSEPGEAELKGGLAEE